jgi:AraC-like DNA-binding protein
MQTILESLFLPQLSDCGFVSLMGRGRTVDDGSLYFVLDSSLGTGSIRICPVERNLAISFQDFSYWRDTEIVWTEPEHFDIILSPSEKNAVSGHLGKNACYHRHIPMGSTPHSISISLLPEFFTESLISRYRIEPGQFARALSTLNESSPPVELAVILKQIGAARNLGNYSRLYYEGKTLELISFILDWHTRQETIFPHGPTRYDRKGIAEAIDYIVSHYSDEISLGVLAKTAAMSVSKFTFIFKSLTGYTAADYIRQVRFEKARELLRESKAPLESIATAVGYKRHASFAAVFKREFGITPSEFRRGGQSINTTICDGLNITPPSKKEN